MHSGCLHNVAANAAGKEGYLINDGVAAMPVNLLAAASTLAFLATPPPATPLIAPAITILLTVSG